MFLGWLVSNGETFSLTNGALACLLAGPPPSLLLLTPAAGAQGLGDAAGVAEMPPPPSPSFPPPLACRCAGPFDG